MNGVKMCSQEGCGRPVVAHGLCARHYQRMRRGSTRDKPGPAPKYPEGQRAKDGGAPTLGVRLPPELHGWVREHGGPELVRALLELRRGMDKHTFVSRVTRIVVGAIKDVEKTHPEDPQPSSVGKRVGTQLWAELFPPLPVQVREIVASPETWDGEPLPSTPGNRKRPSSPSADPGRRIGPPAASKEPTPARGRARATRGRRDGTGAEGGGPA